MQGATTQPSRNNLSAYLRHDFNNQFSLVQSFFHFSHCNYVQCVYCSCTVDRHVPYSNTYVISQTAKLFSSNVLQGYYFSSIILSWTVVKNKYSQHNCHITVLSFRCFSSLAQRIQFLCSVQQHCSLLLASLHMEFEDHLESVESVTYQDQSPLQAVK